MLKGLCEIEIFEPIFGPKYANNTYKNFRISWEFILRWAKDSEKYDEEQLKMKIINAIKDQGLY